MKKFTSLKEYRYWAFLLIFAILINLSANCFSPLYSMEGNVDPVAFYMEGKAWAHGYLPYRDFTDVKGIFLFFIYYIGYVLSPDETWGILALYTLSTFLFGVIAFKTAKLLKLSDFQAIVAVLLCMYARFHSSTSFWAAQPEWLIDTFMIWSFYHFVQVLEEETILGRKEITWAAISTGVCAGACFLVKYNFALIPFVTMLATLLFLYKRNAARNIYITYLSVIIASFVLFVAPFILYLLLNGIFKDFIHDYFLLNVISNFQQKESTIRTMSWRLKEFMACGLFIGLGMAYYIFQTAKNFDRKNILTKRVITLLVVCSYFASCIMGLYGYYYLCFVPVLIIPVAEIVKKLFQHNYGPILRTIIITSCIFAIVIGNGFYRTSRGYWRWKSYKRELAIKQIENELTQIKKPKILYYDTVDHGFGKKACALPACAEWCVFPGFSKELLSERDSVIQRREADYIFAQGGEDFLKASGYEPVPGIMYNNISLWRRSSL